VSEDQLFAYLSRIEANIAELRATTRADIAELRTATQADIAELRAASQADIAELRATSRADIADLSTTTRADIAELRGELHEGIAGLAKNVDIAALGRLVEQQRDDILSLKDDMSVLTAIVSRLDNSHTRLLTEIRATHAQVSRLTDRLGRFDDRVRRLEEERHL
jgi:chromosome segregation ATPase